MERVPRGPLVFVLAVVVATVLAFGGVGAGQSSPTATATPSATLPGTQYAGMAGAQEAEVEAEHRAVAFDIRLANATTNESRAAVVATEVERVRGRVARLEADRRARRNATVEEDVIRVRDTAVVARRVALERHVLRVERAASALPTPVRERYGITPAVFDSLLDRLEALTSPRMVAIALDLAGEDVGEPLDEEDDETDGDDGTDSDGDESGGEESDTTGSGDGGDADGTTDGGDADGTMDGGDADGDEG